MNTYLYAKSNFLSTGAFDFSKYSFIQNKTYDFTFLDDFLKEALYSTVQVFLCDPLKYFKLCK